MSTSSFRIQNPYVLTTLPKAPGLSDLPLSYTIAAVESQRQGSSSRKKRPEIAVGIGGDAINIYHVGTSHLITSYPISPHTALTAPPVSLRWTPSSKGQNAIRYTYVSIQEPATSKWCITLFKDVLTPSGKTTSCTVSKQMHHQSSAQQLILTSHEARTAIGPELSGLHSNLLVVLRDGGLLSLDCETLDYRWQAPASLVARDLPSNAHDVSIEFSHLCAAVDVVNSIYDSYANPFTALGEKVELGAFNPDVLCLVSKSSCGRYIHFATLIEPHLSQTLQQHGVFQLSATPLPGLAVQDYPGRTMYELNVRAASLQVLEHNSLLCFELRDGIAKLLQKMPIQSLLSFLCLSPSIVLASTPSSLDIYDSVYYSSQASVSLNHCVDAVDADMRELCFLSTYFPRLEMAVGLQGSSVVAIQLESPRVRGKKRKFKGLLADSLARGLPQAHKRQKIEDEQEPLMLDPDQSLICGYLPGSTSDEYWTRWTKDTEKANNYLAKGDLEKWERLLAKRFRVDTRPRNRDLDTIAAKDLVGESHCQEIEAKEKEKRKKKEKKGTNNGGHQENEGDEGVEWQWPSSRRHYAKIDRRWVIYAITRLFSWQPRRDLPRQFQLVCQYPHSNVLFYLVDAGHLYLGNMRCALRPVERCIPRFDRVFGEAVPQVLAEIDPTLELLIAYLSATPLDAVELVSITKLIMQSLDLLSEGTTVTSLQRLAQWQSGMVGEDDDQQSNFCTELDRLESQVAAAEFYLDDELGARLKALGMAFGKLSACTAGPTVRALRQVFRPDELLTLIYLLRVELVRDGWTSRYLDACSFNESDEQDAPPNGSASMIGELLCRSLDAAGMAGWLTHMSVLPPGLGGDLDPLDFIAAMQVEVSAAIEGLDEAIYLHGLVTEAVKYGIKAKKWMSGPGAGGRGGDQAMRSTSKAVKMASMNGGVLSPSPSRSPDGGVTMATTQEAKTKVKSKKGKKAGSLVTAHVPLPLEARLPLGLKPARPGLVEKTKLNVASGEVVKRSNREIGYLMSQRISDYSLEQIRF